MALPLIPIVVIGGAALATGLGVKFAGDGIGQAAKETTTSTVKIALLAGAAYLVYMKVKK